MNNNKINILALSLSLLGFFIPSLGFCASLDQPPEFKHESQIAAEQKQPSTEVPQSIAPLGQSRDTANPPNLIQPSGYWGNYYFPPATFAPGPQSYAPPYAQGHYPYVLPGRPLAIPQVPLNFRAQANQNLLPASTLPFIYPLYPVPSPLKREATTVLENLPKKQRIAADPDVVLNPGIKNSTNLDELLKAIHLTPEQEIFQSSDAKQVNIGFKYFEELLKKTNEVRGKTDEKIAKRHLYETLGERIFRRIQNNNIEFPYRVKSPKKALSTFIDLCKYEGQTNLLEKEKYQVKRDSYYTRFCRLGIDASGYYMDKNRFVTKLQHKAVSPIGLMKDKKLFIAEVATSAFPWAYSVKKKGKPELIYDEGFFRNTLIRNYSAFQYFPKSVKDTIKIISDNFPETPVTHVIDLCLGWGDRLVAFLATKDIRRIVGTDPNNSLHEAYNNIYNAYKNPRKEYFKTNNDVSLYTYQQPLEDLTAEQLCPNGVKNNLMLTSPPYFNYELYDEGNNQSYKRYVNYDAWKEYFLKSMIVQSVYAVNLYGFIAINVGVIHKDRHSFHDLPNDVEHIASTYPEWIADFKRQWMERNDPRYYAFYPQYTNLFDQFEAPVRLQKVTNIYYNRRPLKKNEKEIESIPDISENSAGTITLLFRLVPLNDDKIYSGTFVGKEFLKGKQSKSKTDEFEVLQTKSRNNKRIKTPTSPTTQEPMQISETTATTTPCEVIYLTQDI